MQFTFLNNQSYYSLSTLVQDTADIVFTRIGANDPNFNLRREPAFMVRKKGKNELFVTVLEMHGSFDPVSEVSYASSPALKQIEILEKTDEYTIAKVLIGADEILIAQCNKDFDNAGKHVFSKKGMQINWTGPYAVVLNNKKLNQ